MALGVSCMTYMPKIAYLVVISLAVYMVNVHSRKFSSFQPPNYSMGTYVVTLDI